MLLLCSRRKNKSGSLGVGWGWKQRKRLSGQKKAGQPDGGRLFFPVVYADIEPRLDTSPLPA